MTSAVVHAAALAALSLLFLQSPTRRPPLVLEFGAAEPAVGEALLAVDLTVADPLATAPADAIVPTPPPEAAAPPEIAVPLAEESLTLEPVSLDAFVMENSVDGASAADIRASTAATSDAFDRIAGGDLLAAAVGGTGRSPGEGRVAGGTSGGSRATSFFGRGGEGRSVCFVCDNSNSHRDGGFHVVLEELARAVDGLRPDQSFFVVFFSDAAYPLFHPTPVHVLTPATPDNKRRLRSWLETIEMCRGGQGIHDAVKLAGSLEPDVVYLLTDGEMTGTVVDSVAAADFGTAVVHTLGIQQPVVDQRTRRVDADRAREQEACNRNLIAIAAAHGGGFTPVIVPPQAAVLERLRPIARNRARGAVWGLKL